MKARLIKDCSHIAECLLMGTYVDCDMQPVFGRNVWDKNYKIYLNQDDFDGYLVPSNCVESLDVDYLRLKEKIETEKKERQLRFINSWLNIVVSIGPRGGVREIMFNLSNDGKVNTIGRSKSKYYLSLLDELGVKYTRVDS